MKFEAEIVVHVQGDEPGCATLKDHTQRVETQGAHERERKAERNTSLAANAEVDSRFEKESLSLMTRMPP